MNGRRLPDKRTLRVEGLLIDTIQDVIPLGKTFHQLCTHQLPKIDILAKTAKQRQCCSPLYGDPSIASMIARFKASEPLWKTLVHNKRWMSGYDAAPDSYGDMHQALFDRLGERQSDDTGVSIEHDAPTS